MGWAGQFHLQGRNPPQSVGQGRLIRPRHVGIGNHRHIAFQLLLPGPEHRLQIVAPHLLLSLHYKDHIGRRTPFPDRLRHPQHMGKDLPLVIGGSAGQHHAIHHPRLKRIPRPAVPHLRRLHIVVPINQNPPPFSAPRLAPLSQNHRSPGSRHNFRLQAHLSELFLQPRGAVAHRLIAGRVGRNGRESQKIKVVGPIFLGNGHKGILPDPPSPHQSRGNHPRSAFAQTPFLFKMFRCQSAN